MATPGLVGELQANGFVVIPGILSSERLEQLRGASIRSTELARQGRWRHIRTVGKQFPPWDETPEEGIWGVQALMNPDLPDHQVYTDLYFSDEVLDIAKELMQCGDDDLVMELLNMLVRPDRDFELRWHRDDISPEASYEEELSRLNEPEWHTQWNLALYEDDSLILVPGSHRRARTATERAASPHEKYLPDQIPVCLNPGDIAFYNNNILHRGVYSSTKQRMTIHGSVGHVKGSKLRARNVLQHGIGKWVDSCQFNRLEGHRKERAEAMRSRLVKLGRDSGDVGYSLQG